MFIPSEQVIVAMEDKKTCVDVFKEFKTINPKDEFKIVSLHVGKRTLDVIHSDDLYKIFKNYNKETIKETFAQRQFNNLIDRKGKIKLFYITPKEMLKLMPGSNISMFHYQGLYIFSLVTEEGQIITLIQSIKPIVGIDYHLFEMIQKSILKDCVKYIFRNEEIIERYDDQSIVGEYDRITNSWYKNFVEIIIDKYNLIDLRDKETIDNKEKIVVKLSKRLMTIVKKVDSSKNLSTKKLLEFFKSDLLNVNDLLKVLKGDEKASRLSEVNVKEHKEFIRIYLKEFYRPLENIFENLILQPESILSNQEFQNVVRVINESYSKTVNNVIDMTHYIKGTFLQELYHYHTVAVNYHEYKEYDQEVLNIIADGLFEGSKRKAKKLSIGRIRTVCTEISGLTPGIVKNSGNMEEIELTGEDGELLRTGYTSPYIKNMIKNQVIDSSKRFAVIADSLKRLIDEGVITPVTFTDDEDFGLLVQNSSDFEYEKRIMGFYEGERNRIFLLLNNVSIGGLGSVSNSSIMSLILHELMHYAYQNMLRDYMIIFNPYIQTFYQTFFNKYFNGKIPNELVTKYILSLYKMEKNGKSGEMINNLNDVLEYAQTNCDKDLAFMNSKAFEKLFQHLSRSTNESGVQIASLSKMFFTESMLYSYEKVFGSMNKELVKRLDGQNDKVRFASVFYQEFIATSEVAAMIAGTLSKEIYKQQITLTEDHPIAKMINSF